MKRLLLLLLCLNVFSATSIIPDKDTKGQIIQTVSPFASKGSLHYRGTGVSQSCAASTICDIDYTIPTGTYLLNGLEVLNGDYGDIVQLLVIDTSTGTYSTVPNATLDQFGINWNMRKDLVKQLPYDAELHAGMIVRVKYSNNQASTKTIYVNLDLHLNSQ